MATLEKFTVRRQQSTERKLWTMDYGLWTKTGFTLIELLVVVSIMGLILAVAAPVFIHSQRGLKLRAAANNIATALRTARSYAITKHGEYAVDFDLDEDRFCLVYPDPDDTHKRTIIEKRFKLLENIDIYSSTFYHKESEPGSITINDANDPDNGETPYRAIFKSTGGYKYTLNRAVWIKDPHGNIKRISIRGTTGAVEIDEIPPA